MRVNLAAQVLSENVGNALNSFGEARNDANFTENAKSKMFFSWFFYDGLQITVLSFKEVCKFLLQQDVPYILSERFCQDDLEDCFSKQRAIGRRSDHTTIYDLDIMTTQLRINFRSDPLEETCKLLQEHLIKYVMNLYQNEKNKMLLKKFIVALAVAQVRDY